MDWLAPALLAPVLWAASNLVDGRLVRSRALSAPALCAITGVCGVIPALMLLVGNRHHCPDVGVVVIAGLAGLLSLASYYPYYRALDAAHPAIAVLLWNLAPALVALFAFVFLSERLATRSVASILLLVGSAFLISLPGARRQCSKETIGWMAVASISVAAEAVLLKWLFAQAPFEVVLILTYSVGALVGLLVMAVAKTVRREVLRNLRGSAGKLVVLNEVTNLAAGFASSVAVSMGPVSLVKAVGGLQPLFVLGFGVLAGRWLPSRSTRPLEIPTPWVAIAATGLAVCGLGLLG